MATVTPRTLIVYDDLTVRTGPRPGGRPRTRARHRVPQSCLRPARDGIRLLDTTRVQRSRAGSSNRAVP